MRAVVHRPSGKLSRHPLGLWHRWFVGPDPPMVQLGCLFLLGTQSIVTGPFLPTLGPLTDGDISLDGLPLSFDMMYAWARPVRDVAIQEHDWYWARTSPEPPPHRSHGIIRRPDIANKHIIDRHVLACRTVSPWGFTCAHATMTESPNTGTRGSSHTGL